MISRLPGIIVDNQQNNTQYTVRTKFGVIKPSLSSGQLEKYSGYFGGLKVNSWEYCPFITLSSPSRLFSSYNVSADIHDGGDDSDAESPPEKIAKVQRVCSFADVKANVKLDVPVTSSVFLVKDNVNVIALLICDAKYRDIEHGNLFSIPCKCKCDCTLDL